MKCIRKENPLTTAECNTNNNNNKKRRISIINNYTFNIGQSNNTITNINLHNRKKSSGLIYRIRTVQWNFHVCY